MKKIFLISFSTQILIEVAKNLKAKGIDIVFWQGYRDDFDMLAKTKAGFETTIFRHAFDAIKNIPPREIDASEFEPVSREVIEKIYPYGWHALSMVSRADYTNSPFVKHRHIYYAYLKFWQGMIKKLKPDAIVFVSIPHSATLIVLYGLAKVMNIKMIMLGGLSQLIDSRVLLLNDYTIGSLELRDEYERRKDAVCAPEDLSEDLREYYLTQKNSQAPHNCSDERYAHLLSTNNKMPFRLPSFMAMVKHLLRFTFFKTAKSYFMMLFSTRKTHYYDKDFTGLKMMIQTRRWSKMGQAHQKEYKALQIQPDFQKKYVYIPLAFQPEMTTCPMGSVFDDQLLMIDIVAASLPDDWVVYVKEHLPQWYAHHTETHMYRYAGYYREIASKKNVYLIPAETHPYELIKNAQAVATVTGTTGWEAVLRSKPALVFGSIWYMYCEGVFRITNQHDCQVAFEKINQGYTVNQRRVFNYLVALDRVSIKAKNYKTRNYIDNKQVSKEENISNLTNALYKAIISE